MANSFSIRAKPSAAGRIKLVDIDIPGTYSISLITVSSMDTTPEWEIYIDKDVNELALPSQPTLSSATTGGTIPRNTKVFVRITTVDADGKEGPPSHGGRFITTGSTTDTNAVTLSLSAVTGAVAYRIYSSTKPGASTLLGETSTTSFQIQNTPVNSAMGIPTSPDIVMLGRKGGVEPIPLGGTTQIISSKLIVYCTIGTAADCAFTMVTG